MVTLLLLLLSNRTPLRQTQIDLEASLEEKEILLRELHHRVKNNMAIITSLLNLQRDSTNDESARAVIDTIQTRVYSMAVFHEKIYETSTLTRIDLEDYFRSLGGYTSHLYSHLVPNLKLRYEIEPFFLDPSTLIPLGLITTEAITNAMKHAFVDVIDPVITIEIRASEAKRILKISDNGIGSSIDLEAGGVGLTVMTALARQIEATIDFDGASGTSVTVILASQSASPDNRTAEEQIR